ncbi:ACP S-malonyltransferase [Sorangium sp. So ce590]|uniref:ACP S-malonyltransferase n=1 Tax=Sorangium sp. So ce590 TaxID=3133317 RepID=UPI003F6088A1
MKAYMFPGQGSQAKGMGRELFDAFPALAARADGVLGYSIRALCQDDPHQRLNETQFTQPALYVVNALSYLKRREEEAPPDFLAGHSLGEFSALFAAGVFDFETGLALVKKRGELMGAARGGGMAAVIGLDAERVRELLEQNGATAIDIANLNSPSQVVISGAKDEIARLQVPFEAAGAKKYAVLRVSAAFHSRFMRPAMVEFGRFLEGYDFAPPKIPVISNVTARPLRPDRIRAALGEQIASPVRWCESIRYLMGRGVKQFVECGHGIVLTGLYSQIRRDAQPLVEEDGATGLDRRGSSAEGRPPDVGGGSRELATPATKGTAPPAPSPPRPAAPAASPPAASPPAASPPAARGTRGMSLEVLGSATFREDYRLRYAYVAGSLIDGISSTEVVVRMGKAGLIGYLGTKGVALDAVEESILHIQRELRDGESYGVSLWCDLDDPYLEWQSVALYLKHDIRYIEAVTYLQITPALVYYRLKGAYRDHRGRAVTPRRVLARVSNLDVARAFMSPAEDHVLDQLVKDGRLTREEGALGRELPISDDLCAHADSGGPTDMGITAVLMPAMARLRDDMMARSGYAKPIRVGAAGGLGAPEAIASAFMLGADFIVTNSVNQCSAEASTSDRVKDMLQTASVHDTAYAPAGDLFELGGRVQVLKRGVLFPARANRLYELYRHYPSLDALDGRTRDQLEKHYFRCDLDEVWRDALSLRLRTRPAEAARAERDPRHRMALVFRRYFTHSSELARRGDEEHRVNYQVHCGPAMGAFNQWAKGTDLEDWRNRHVDVIAERLMRASADLLDQRMRVLSR